MSWSPVLEGADRDEAVAAVDRIADALRREPPEAPIVGGGLAGTAVFFAHRGLARQDPADWDLAWELLDRAIARLAELELSPGLFGGFTGVAWALAHANSLGDDEPDDTDDEFAEVDDLLGELLAGPWPGDYDLIGGLAGLAVYALARLPDPPGARLCERLVEQADAMAEERGGEVSWLTPAERLPPWQADVAPEGFYNAGVAHGIPGMLAALAQIAGAGLGGPRARALVDGAAAWIDRVAGQSPAPAWIPVGGSPPKARQAWCYGDPGIAGALMCAARAVGDDDLAARARTIATRAAAVPLADSGVVDPGLCHGGVGNGHIFNRLWQATGDPELLQAARRCYRRGLDLLVPGALFAGVGADRDGELIAAPGLLEGAAGVGLGLLAATGELEPTWDQLLLLSPVR